MKGNFGSMAQRSIAMGSLKVIDKKQVTSQVQNYVQPSSHIVLVLSRRSFHFTRSCKITHAHFSHGWDAAKVFYLFLQRSILFWPRVPNNSIKRAIVLDWIELLSWQYLIVPVRCMKSNLLIRSPIESNFVTIFITSLFYKLNDL